MNNRIQEIYTVTFVVLTGEYDMLDCYTINHSIRDQFMITDPLPRNS